VLLFQSAVISHHVSFTDSEGLEHAGEVSASSVYEAAVLTLAEFRRCTTTNIVRTSRFGRELNASSRREHLLQIGDAQQFRHAGHHVDKFQYAKALIDCGHLQAHQGPQARAVEMTIQPPKGMRGPRILRHKIMVG
jgi:hypothetical protein